MKKLLIVESPGKIKKIKEILGEGFEVSASIGHIRDLPKDDLGIDKINNFKPLYQINSDKKDVVKNLQSKIDKIGKDNVFLATDEDREGEAIAYHLCVALNLDYKSTKRITFNEITKEAITKSVMAPRLINMSLVSAQEARRTIDRLVGYQVSPVLWKKIESTNKTALSAGRVQSIALKLVVDRYHEHFNFDYPSFYSLSAYFKTNKEEIIKAKYKGDIEYFCKDKDSFVTFIKDLSNTAFFIDDVNATKEEKKPQAPFTTSTLQQVASKKLKFPVDKTMQLAQKLYEGGHITYMRTDSCNLSEQAMMEAQKFIIDKYGDKYSKVSTYKNKTANAQEAHEAVRPTHFEVLNPTGDGELDALYNLIHQRAVASQMSPAVFNCLSISIMDHTKKHLFEAKPKVLFFEGFMAYYEEPKEEEEQEEEGEDNSILKNPILKGDALVINFMKGSQSFKSPPKFYDDADIVKELERRGIGRPATYSSIIKNIITRNYIEIGKIKGKSLDTVQITYKDGFVVPSIVKKEIGNVTNKFIPTETGILLCKFLSEQFTSIMDYDFTSKVEAFLDDISNQKDTYVKVVKDFDNQLMGIINGIDANFKDVVKESKVKELYIIDNVPVFGGSGEYGDYLIQNKVYYNFSKSESFKGKKFTELSKEDCITLISEVTNKEKEKNNAVVKVVGKKYKVYKTDKGYSLSDGDVFASLKYQLTKFEGKEMEYVNSLDEKTCKEIITNFKNFIKKNKK